MPPHQQQGGRGKHEPLRHIDKTNQDHQPVSERIRVKQAAARRAAMRQGGAPIPVDPTDDTPTLETR